MSKWSKFYKVIEVTPEAVKLNDSQSIDGAGVYGNHSWFQRLVQGSASRLTRYREYSLMDNDVSIARALDTIAEEIIGNEIGSEEPLQVFIDSDREEEIQSSTVQTLKTALKYWTDIHDFSITLFKIARTMVKYGDCFFEKQPDKHEARWNYINPYHVLGALVDKDDITKILGWQVKTGAKSAKDSFSEPLGGYSGMIETEVKASMEIVRFTMNDFLSENAPFGESILGPVYRAHKQKQLIEDAIIIYRIQRAPERRVFYIDVGNMPAARTKAYLENIKNEIKQKKVPNIHGGQQDVDTVYNPQSMCLALDTKIPLLDGRTLTLQEMIQEHNEGKQNWVYSVDPDTGNTVPGIVSWAGITQKNTKTIKLTLDNGDEIVCTPEHKFPVQGKGKVEAKDLTENDSLWPLQLKQNILNGANGKKTTGKYTQVYNPATNNHRVVKIEDWTDQDVGTLTIDQEEKYHNYHTFALTSCFVYNSEDFFFASRADSRGSRVETLPGGQNLGSLEDLQYFQQEVWRGLRIPTSYMTDGTEGAVYNDGKVGIAYIQELRFSLYIQRLQAYLETVLDREFKAYLRKSNIYIDSALYKIKLPEPSNFGVYRQQEIDASLLQSYGSAESITYLSPRFKMTKYLRLTDEEIILNERMKREEMGMDPDGTNKEDLQRIYGDADAGGDLGMGAGGLSGDVGGAEPGDVTADDIPPEGETESPPE